MLALEFSTIVVLHKLTRLLAREELSDISDTCILQIPEIIYYTEECDHMRYELSKIDVPDIKKLSTPEYR